MAKCIVSGMGVGGGDGWVLMDEWDAVRSTLIEVWQNEYYFTGSLKDSALYEYSMAKVEVSGNVIMSNNCQTNQTVCKISVCPRSISYYEVPPYSKNYVQPIHIVTTMFLTFDEKDPLNRYCVTCPEKYMSGNYETYPRIISEIALRLGTSNSVVINSVNLHVKVYAKK